ncbi:hypothetical protein ACFX15_006114 [Malus domestica]
MRVFCCFAYATSVHPPFKFSPQAYRCVFLGYPRDKKAYKVYDLETHKIFTNRDVIFLEDTFPFDPSTTTITSPNLPDLTHSTPLPLPFVTTTSDIPPSLFTLQPDHVPSTSSHPTLLSYTTLPSTSLSTLTDPSPQPSPSDPLTEPILAPSLVAKPTRFSTRHKEPNVHLRDYVCSQVMLPPLQSSSLSSFGSTICTRYPICNSISYHRYSPLHLSFVALISRSVEPSSFAEALQDPNWRQAIDSKLDALSSNNIWTLTLLPPGKRPIDCKLVYKIKHNVDGSIERYKARLVAK